MIASSEEHYQEEGKENGNKRMEEDSGIHMRLMSTPQC